ncbi:non-ribosomal peptide synthetase [Ornithinibacillus scapharcae]|uniref:non-ribosomal peptide synthetase n=1 Tax=Ornithinibacillus scapharcae TaxID=1147159 RepID=UPI000225AE86|nr:non-ribosomal peptide synthetase [Ornithinibacillus scapharcae]
MSDLRKRLESLTPEQRDMVLKKLKNKRENHYLSNGGRHVIPRHEERGSYPLSSIQKQIWFMSQLNPELPIYNEHLIKINLSGKVNIEALKKSFEQIVNRHQILRMRVKQTEDSIEQVITKSEPTIQFLSLRGISGEEQQEILSEYCRKEANYPYRLEQENLIRMSIIELSESSYSVLFSRHHILSDGWSASILLSELERFYNMYSQNGEINPEQSQEELTIQYHDYALWQEKLLTSENLEKGLEYWKEKLEGDLPMLSIGGITQEGTGVGSEYNFKIPNILTDKLRKLAEEQKVSLYSVWLAIYKIVISKYTQETDLAVGTPIAGRNIRETRNVIGPFINTVVIRTKAEQNLSVIEYLQQVHETTIQALENQDVPFEKVVEVLNPNRDVRANPFYQLLFVMQEPPTQFSLPGIKVEYELIPTEVARFPLTLSIIEGEEMIGRVLYRTSILSEYEVQSFVQRLLQVADEIVQSPHQRIYDLNLLTSKERSESAYLYNQSGCKPFPTEPIHVQFEGQVLNTPNSIALSDHERSYTYLQTNNRANQIARWLQKQGIGKEDFIGIQLQPCAKAIIAMLGVLKAGGAYLPLDVESPKERIEIITQDSKLKAIITHSEYKTSYEGYEVPILYIDQLDDFLLDEREDNLNVDCDSSQLAYGIYTSGSTGIPKGVLVEHRNLSNYIYAIQTKLGNKPKDRYLLLQSLAYDFCLTTIYTSLLSGGTLFFLLKEDAIDPAKVEEIVQGKAIDWYKITPSHLKALSSESGTKLFPRKGLILGGEASEWSWIKEIYRNIPASCKLFNHYGPSETTIGVAVYEVTKKGLSNQFSTTPIGSSLSNNRIYILDDKLRPVPSGIPGHIYIAGEQVARGYLNREELTAERFMEDPFITDSRMYKTGDIGKILYTGEIQFLGRLDGQVKIRGIRVEPEEIQSQLLSHPSITEAIVTVTKVRNEEQLVAYYVSKKEVLDKDLQTYLKQKLPPNLVPAYLVKMDTLPRHAHGKIDRKALPEIQVSNWNEIEIQPMNRLEEKMKDVWEKILERPVPSIDDSFFKLGGHSLLATRLVSMIRKEFKVELSIKEFFEKPSIRELSTHLLQLEAVSTHFALSNISEAEKEKGIPLSDAQKRMWFLYRMESDSAYYNMPISLKIIGDLDYRAFTESIQEVNKRHDSLRTVFRESKNIDPVQVVLKDLKCTINILDFDENRSEQDIMNYLTEKSMEPFKLETGPLIRVHLVKSNPNEHVLLIVQHHIISDGWSLRIMMDELFAIYHQIISNMPIQLEQPVYQYADYVNWQQNRYTEEQINQQLQYWKEQLSGAPSLLELPLDKPRPSMQSYNGSLIRMKLPEKHAVLIKEICEEAKVTPYTIFLTFFNILLYRYTYQDKILVGTPIANRNIQELEGILGLFVNTLVIPSTVKGDRNFKSLLQQVNNQILGALENQDISFERIVQELNPERSLSYNPIYQVAFTLQNDEQGKNGNYGGLSVEEFEIEWRTSKVDLTLIIGQSKRGFEMVMEYNTDLFRQQSIEQMLSDYIKIISQVIENPNMEISRIQLVDQQHDLLVKKAESQPRSIKDCIQYSFENWVRSSPNHIALRFLDRSYTYDEVNKRANKIANQLYKMGIRRGDRVALYHERSSEMIFGFLGILKCGAAYVPIDSELPLNRRDFILKDASVGAIVTQTSLEEKLSKSDLPYLCTDQSQDSEDYSLLTKDKSYPEDIAYIIYTSGTTGTPNGVMVKHSSVMNLISATIDEFNITQETKVGQFATISFDASLWQILMALLAGATLCVVSREEQLSTKALVKRFRDWNVTLADLPPVVLDSILPEDIPSLQTVSTGGERCPIKVAKRWSLDRNFYNVYGPTETTIATTWYRVSSPECVQDSVPIGTPVPNTEVFILDPDLNPVPMGVIGEIYIGGVGVSNGYLNRDDLNEKRFIPHPFREEEILYKTGDIGKVLHDGNLEHLGRLDHQIKVRGFRIELGEIESLLNLQTGVKEAIVQPLGDNQNYHTLVAYVVPHGEWEEKKIIEELRSKLPEHMVPSIFVQMEELPRLNNKKVDRHSLPTAVHIFRQQKVIQKPVTEEEVVVAECWAETLNLPIDNIGLNSNFFELGGHSLTATQLVARISELFEIELPIKAIFEYPTIQAILDFIVEMKLELGGEELDSLFEEIEN